MEESSLKVKPWPISSAEVKSPPGESKREKLQFLFNLNENLFAKDLNQNEKGLVKKNLLQFELCIKETIDGIGL